MTVADILQSRQQEINARFDKTDLCPYEIRVCQDYGHELLVTGYFG